MKPMLARTYGPKFNQFPVYVQPKLNGVRALYQNGTFQSRDEKLWRPNVLRHLVDELQRLTALHWIAPDTILDGELYVHGWRLGRISGAVAPNRADPNEDTPHIEYHVFDTVDLNKTFYERWQPLWDRIHKNEDLSKLVYFVPHMFCSSNEIIKDWFRHFTAEGYEGVMIRPDSLYEFGISPHGTERRSKSLWKYKSWQDGEFMCFATTGGAGKADIGIGALWCRTDKGAEFKIGTGFTDEERIEFYENPPIDKLIKVRYLELTKDGIPFNASFMQVMI